MRLLQRVRGFVRAVASAHGSPARLFAACVVGGVIGSTPFYGLHLPICILLARVLRLNQVAVYGTANISIPPLAPLLAFGCIEIGSRVLTGHGVPLTLAAMRAATHGTAPWALARDVLLAWLVGAPLLGSAIGAVIGAVVYVAARTREQGRLARRPSIEPFMAATAELNARFRHAPMGIRQYVKWKVRLDPVYRAVAEGIADSARVVELGAGLGILPILLSLLGVHRKVIGVDWDEDKVREGRVAAAGLRVDLIVADVREWEPPPCDVLIIVDVLHYFDAQTQRAILERAAGALVAGGTLLVRDADAARGRGGSTRALERLAVMLGWTRSAQGTNFRPASAVVEELRTLGLTDVTAGEVAGRFHPGNALIRARKARIET